MRISSFIFCSLIGMAVLQNCSSKKHSVANDTLKVIHSSFVDSVASDFPVSFASVFVDDWQCIAYYNKTRNLTLAMRNVNDSMWKHAILPSKVGWDSHNYIAMALDKNKCIHVSGNMHNDTLLYYKSKKPLDIKSLTRVFPQVNIHEEFRCTYPEFFKDNNDNLIYSYRLGGSGNGINILNKYNADTKTFERLTNAPLFDGLGLKSAYKSGPHKGPDGKYHLAWLWRSTPACETSHELSYCSSTDLIHWTSLSGEQSEIPITPNSTAFIVDPVPEKGGTINGNFRLFFDSIQTPYIAYLKFDDKGFNQIYLAREENKKWKISKISNWDYRWEFSGPGSIEFEIKIGDATFENNKIAISYYHIKNGDGTLVVDPKKMTIIEEVPIEHKTSNLYPEHLISVQSPVEGMSVKWLQKKTSKENTLYAFRWETLGKRRFYKAPEVPVKPSALILYTFTNKY